MAIGEPYIHSFSTSNRRKGLRMNAQVQDPSIANNADNDQPLRLFLFDHLFNHEYDGR